MAAHAKFVPSIATSSPGAFEQPLQSPLSTSMSSHHQSSERSGWRDEGHDDETAQLDEQAVVEGVELEEGKVEGDGWMEGGQVTEPGEEGEARWPDETEHHHPAHEEVDENAVYQDDDQHDKLHHEDDGSHLHHHEGDHLEHDEGAHDHVEQAEPDEGGHPDDQANGSAQQAQAGAQAYVYPHSPAPQQQGHPNGSRPGSGTSSPYHPNGAQASYPSQHLQQQHPASAYAAPYPTTGSQAYYGVPSTHPLQNAHYPSSNLPPSYGSPSSQHQPYPTSSAYGYPAQPYPTSYNYLGQQPSGSSQYGSQAGGYRPSQPMQGHLQHQLSLPHLGAVTSASRTGVDEAGRMSAAHSEHSYDQNDPEGRAELGRLLEHGVGIDQNGLSKVGKNGGSAKGKKRKSEGDALGAEGVYEGEEGSELGGEGEDGEGGQKKRKRSSLGDANGNGPKDKKHVCPECQRGFARAYNLKTHIQTHSPDPPKPHVCPHDSCGHKAFSRSHDLMRHKGSVHGEGTGIAKSSTTPRKKRSPKKPLHKVDGEQDIDRSVDHMLGAEGLAGLEHHQQGPFDNMDHHQEQYSLQDLDVPGGPLDVGGSGLGGGPEGPFGEFEPQPLHEPYGAADDNNP